jgi:molybdate-binding protein
MNYILKVETSNIDKVILKLLALGDAITIKNILRNEGAIYVKTNLLTEVRSIQEVQDIRREKLIPQFLVF